MPLFEFNAQPLDLADYPRALASLREPSLLGEIKELAYEQDLPRLRVALEAGVFDAKPFIDKALASPMSAAAIQDHWVGRCSAMMAVMGLVTVSQEAEGVEGRRYALEFNLNDDTKAFMVEYLGHLAQQAKLWRDQMGPTMTDASAVAVNQGMHLACMLDRPDALQTLLDACRHAVHLPLDDAKIGGGIIGHKRSDDNVPLEVMTLFTAMQFSSKACVEKLLTEVGDDMTLYTKREPEKAPETVSFLKSFNDIQHRGSTAAMVPIMKHFLTEFVEEDDDGKVEHSLLETLGEILNRSTGGIASRNTNVIPACLEAGWIDVDVKKSVEAALSFSHPLVIEHLKDRMPWDFVAELGNRHATVLPAIKALDRGRTKGFQTLAAIAKDQGPNAMAAVVNNFGSNGQMREKTTHGLTRKPAGQELLPKLLTIGLDPHWKIPGENKSMLEFAKEAGSPSFSVMSSFLARGRAHELIAEMNAEPRKPQP